MSIKSLEEYQTILKECFDEGVDIHDFEVYKLSNEWTLEKFGWLIAEGVAFSNLSDSEHSFVDYEKYAESMIEEFYDPMSTINPGDDNMPYFWIDKSIVRKVDV